MEKTLAWYGVTHRFSTAYHQQTSGQVENANRGVKRILEKTVGKTRKDWSDKLDDALWAFRTAFKMPIGTIPFRMVYGKACHLPVELEHGVYWALRSVNLDLTQAVKNRYLQIYEVEELRDEAYARSWSYKERILRSRWGGPYMVKEVFPHGAVEVRDVDGSSWKVNLSDNYRSCCGHDEIVEFENDAGQVEKHVCKVGIEAVQGDEIFTTNKEHEMEPGHDYDPEVLKASYDYTMELEEDYYHDPYEGEHDWDSDWSNDDCHWK
ncbi:uncharacterized protein LOC143619779 [Bidens hawaiensis]|uniref:uncharacterized protein LOC143619779 n=1 Tax=Bidens hawaiensis TaxID=980011 RepID=UPI00404B7732